MPERPEVIKMRENAHDRQYVLENVSKEGGLLDYAGEEMKDDREIALAAIHNNPEALEYVSDRLKADRAFTIYLGGIHYGKQQHTNNDRVHRRKKRQLPLDHCYYTVTGDWHDLADGFT